MRRRIVSWLLAWSIILAVCPMLAVSAQEPSDLISWTDNGFKRYAQTEAAPDELPQSISLEAARNEYERGQIVVRSDVQNFTITAVEFTSLQKAGGGEIAAENLAYHFALYEVNIPTDHCGMPWQPSMQGKPLYAKDAMCDALSNAASIDVAKGCNQPIYLEAYVPADTEPGLYKGMVTVKTSLGDFQKELTVQAYSATVPALKDAGFTYFNWMTDIAQGYYTEWNAFTSYYDIEDVNADGTDFTKDFYDILNNWAKIAADHRQNMVMISTTALLDAANSKVDGDGHYTFDWSLFDKYVDVWLNHGVTRLAGIHFGYHGKDVMLKDDGKGNAAFAWEPYSVGQANYDKEKDNWYRQYLPALAGHLEEYDITGYPQFAGTENKTLFDVWCQHLYDEPSNYRLWMYYADLADTYLVNSEGKQTKLFDADNSGCTKNADMAAKMDILVPLESIETDSVTYFQEQAAQGKEFWTYVCIGPGKPWLNRFVHQPDTTYPILFWYDAQIDATGYLHWGMNVWNVGPFADGDSYMVYPDKEGKTLLNSIRFDGQRDGIEDWELAQLAKKTDPVTTQALLNMAVTHPKGQYVTNLRDFRALRHALLELASGNRLQELPELSGNEDGVPELPENAYYVDDTDERIQYTNMSPYTNGGTSYGGTVHYNNCSGEVGTDGGSAAFTFTGDGIAVMGEKGFNAGNLRVDLYDADLQLIDTKTVNCNAAQIEPYFISYKKTDLSYGTYTIKITNVRTELSGKEYSQMVLDAFIVYDGTYAENSVTVKKVNNTKGEIILKADGKEVATGDRVPKGTEVTITAKPISGLYCQYIDVNGRIMRAPCTVKADCDLLIGAEFQIVPDAAAPKNVALNKTVTASSVDTANSYTLAGAVDGAHSDAANTTPTAWSNLADTENQTGLTKDEWLCVDLGQNYSIDKVVLTWSNWRNVVPDTYMVQARADGVEEFKPVFTQNGKETGPEQFAHIFEPLVARYVKILIPKVGNETMGWHAVRLNELEVYCAPVEPDKAALREKIKAAEGLSASDYTEESWAVLEKALRSAQIVDVDIYAAQAQIEAASSALNEAINALQKKSQETDKTELGTCINAAKALREGDYTAESWAVMQSALTEAERVYADSQATQIEIDAANTALREAINALVRKPDTKPDWKPNVPVEPEKPEKPEKPEARQSFDDVFPGDYYYDAVNWSAENGITTGVDAYRFGPNQVCTRAQAVTFLWRAAGSPEPKSAKNPFSDVKGTDYFCKAVLWALDEGITQGISDTTFGADEMCSRSHIVTFLWRAQHQPQPAASRSFADVTENDYFYDAVAWASEEKITTGTSDAAFSPDAPCTRAQIVTFLYRFHSL